MLNASPTGSGEPSRNKPRREVFKRWTGSSLGAAADTRRKRMARTGLAAPEPGRSRRGLGLLRRVCDRVVLRLHRLADRLDLVPPEFGGDPPVDADDAEAIVAEWKRYLRLWAGYNPEEVFALKVGGAVLFAVIVALWLAIALIL